MRRRVALGFGVALCSACSSTLLPNLRGRVQLTSRIVGTGRRNGLEDMGMDSAKIQQAIAWANAHESTVHPSEMKENIAKGINVEPFNEIIGPVKERTGVNGLITAHGYIVAEWGDTLRTDMTFSATKSYLATVTGLALDRGLIRSVDDPVKNYVDDGTFDSPHNSKITWRHLLNQTSEWEGTLWGKPD